MLLVTDDGCLDWSDPGVFCCIALLPELPGLMRIFAPYSSSSCWFSRVLSILCLFSSSLFIPSWLSSLALLGLPALLAAPLALLGTMLPLISRFLSLWLGSIAGGTTLLLRCCCCWWWWDVGGPPSAFTVDVAALDMPGDCCSLLLALAVAVEPALLTSSCLLPMPAAPPLALLILADALVACVGCVDSCCCIGLNGNDELLNDVWCAARLTRVGL